MDELLKKSKELARNVRDGVQRHITVDDPVQLLAVAKAQARLPHAQDKTVHTLNAQRLLGDSVDVEQYSQLKHVKLMTAAESFVSSQPTSVEDFLKAERQNSLISAVITAQEVATQDFHRHHFEYLKANWDRRDKAEMRRILGVDMNVNPAPSNSQKGLNKMQDVIRKFVDSIVKQYPFPIITELKTVVMNENLQILEMKPDEFYDQMRTRVVKLLEGRFNEYIRAQASNLDQFVQMQHNQHLFRMTDGDDRWVYLFFALRSGDWDAALNSPLCKEDDTLRRAVAACKIDSEPTFDITTNMSSQASLLRLIPPHNIAKFKELQHEISRVYGERHFQADRNPWNYIRSLLLTAQFELAVEFLQRVDLELAVHLAIPLYHFGALRATSNISENILVPCEDSTTDFKFNFGLLLQRYVRATMNQHPRLALDYVYLLRNIRVSDAEDSPTVFIMNLSDIILENRDLSLLGTSVAGVSRQSHDDVISRFITERTKQKHFLAQLAKEFRQRGLFPQSIRLYQLAEEHSTAITLLTEKLSEAIILDNHQDASWGEYIDLIGKSMPVVETSCLMILQNICLLIDSFHRQQYSYAFQHWQALCELRVIPTSPEYVNDCLESKLRLQKELQHQVSSRQLPQDAIAWQTRGRALLMYMAEAGQLAGTNKAHLLQRLQQLVEEIEIRL
eukprot:gene8322-868_t